MSDQQFAAIRDELRVVSAGLERLVEAVERAATQVVESMGEVRAAVEHQTELDHGGRP